MTTDWLPDRFELLSSQRPSVEAHTVGCPIKARAGPNFTRARMSQSKLLSFVSWAVIAAMASIGLAAANPPEKKRAATPLDGVRMTRISDLAVAPNGRSAIFSRDALAPTETQREHSLWSVQLDALGSARPLTKQPGDALAAWSPDGRLLAFLRAKGERPQIFAMAAEGGPARPLSAMSGEIESFSWAPDSRSLVLTVMQPAPNPASKTLPDVQIFTRADYRTEGEYRNSEAGSRLWILPVSAASGPAIARPLTDAKSSTTFAFWSGDSRTVYFTQAGSRKSGHGIVPATGLYSIGVGGGPARLVRAFDSIPAEFVPSPNHRYVAFVQADPKAPREFAQTKVMVMDLKSNGKPTDITARYDRPAGTNGFQTELVWRDDTHLLAIALDSGNGSLIDIDRRTGQISPWWTGTRVITQVAGSPQSHKIIALASSFTQPQELYDISIPQRPVRLTTENKTLADELALTAPEQISFKDAGGQLIHGYLQMPYAFDRAKKYPMVVWVHGGPYWFYNSGYNADVQATAGAGYVVLYMNPRGSLSYGQAFASALNGHWPGYDFDDVLRGARAIAKRPFVDPTKVGIAGCSGGGIMVDWAITHTHFFKAAVAGSDIADFSQYWFVGDEVDLKRPGQRAPWQDPKLVRESPLTDWRSIETPTLFISGSRDFRTPSSAGGEMMFRVLKYLTVPTALIRVEGAGHCLNQTQDARDESVLSYYVVRWMDRYLKGHEVPEFAAGDAAGN